MLCCGVVGWVAGLVFMVANADSGVYEPVRCLVIFLVIDGVDGVDGESRRDQQQEDALELGVNSMLRRWTVEVRNFIAFVK